VSNPGEDIFRHNASRRGLNDGCGVADLGAYTPPNQVPGGSAAYDAAYKLLSRPMDSNQRRFP
jgi:hypothetical protein